MNVHVGSVFSTVAAIQIVLRLRGSAGHMQLSELAGRICGDLLRTGLQV